MSNLYDQDFMAWTEQQANLLRSGHLNELDTTNLLEEVESMGKSQKRELLHRMAVLLTHLLKWTFQPAMRSRSWEATIDEQRDEIRIHLQDNPSLKARAHEILYDSYRLGILGAIKETGIDKKSFPIQCLWSIEQILDENFWPE